MNPILSTLLKDVTVYINVSSTRRCNLHVVHWTFNLHECFILYYGSICRCLERMSTLLQRLQVLCLWMIAWNQIFGNFGRWSCRFCRSLDHVRPASDISTAQTYIPTRGFSPTFAVAGLPSTTSITSTCGC